MPAMLGAAPFEQAGKPALSAEEKLRAPSVHVTKLAGMHGQNV
eukprot:CAMPEP_0206140376 /NCGR_PEP_ID=MMETSP1473-20131121/9230_1 /ASSEMBLY_ACC=CAM_ASM_001109 /TAXON_ID=1461547 /ORGANISM="Stichococcus sp, Strain RCC1054" /LENGTH=42 /DNA_ID= /DNA_START= /DNA_END= /DNA_ORIENTATION=